MEKLSDKRSNRRIGLWIGVGVAMIAVALGVWAMQGSIFSQPTIAPATGPSPSLSSFGKLPMQFEPNVGQTDASVRFMAHAPGGIIFFTPSEVTLSLETGTSDQGSRVGERYTPADDRRLASGP